MGPVESNLNDRIALHLGRLLIQGETLAYQLEIANKKLERLDEIELELAEINKALPKKKK